MGRVTSRHADTDHPRDDPLRPQGAAARPSGRGPARGDGDRARAGIRLRGPAHDRRRRAVGVVHRLGRLRFAGPLSGDVRAHRRGDADPGGAGQGGVRVRPGPGRRRGGLRRGPVRPRAACGAGAEAGGGGPGGPRRIRRGQPGCGSGRAPRSSCARCSPPCGTPPGPGRSPSWPSPSATTASPGSTSPVRKQVSRPPGTSTHSSTCAGRTPISPSTPARRSACRRSGRRCSGAAPTGSGTACGSSTTSPWPQTVRPDSAGSPSTFGTSASRSRWPRRPTSRPGRPSRT